MGFTFDGNRVAYYSHGLDLDLMPPAKYVGIGKYTGELNDRYRLEIEQMQRILANNEIASVPGRNVGSVLAYSFDRNGTHYQGQLQYRSSDEINGKLSFLYELAQDSARNDAGARFQVALVEKYLSAASRAYASVISVKPGQSVKVEFVVPHDALTFDPGASRQQIPGGTYRMFGEANVNIQSPLEMKGKAFIRMDKLSDVDLTER
ncbi:hypothetical protein WL32_25545 [Burkholderia cepacia]|nr:hypothetical protein WL32_25545 [Burkholderia cepacia]